MSEMNSLIILNCIFNRFSEIIISNCIITSLLTNDGKYPMFIRFNGMNTQSDKYIAGFIFILFLNEFPTIMSFKLHTLYVFTSVQSFIHILINYIIYICKKINAIKIIIITHFYQTLVP